MSFNIVKIAEQKQVSGCDFPLVVAAADTVAESEQNTLNWVAENKALLHEKLIEHGAILLRGFNVGDAESFEKLLDQTDFKNMPYVGGAAPRTLVTSSRIVTANEAPATETIPFHHEMAQTPEPPGYIFFYCDIAPETGGATSILHSNEIAKEFFDIDAQFAEKIEQQGVRYIRFMPEITDTESPIGRSWKDTFHVTTKEEAEAALIKHDMTGEWCENNVLKTVSSVLPAIRFDEETQQKTFFNSILAVYTGWDDPRNVGKEAVIAGDGSFMNEEIMDETQKRMADLCVNFEWHEGDVLLVNNHTVLHAREPFTGNRRILASISYK